MRKKQKSDKTRISLAGEFAVLSQLALRGQDASMTLGNTKGVDILISDPVTGRMLKLEVKTHRREIRDTGVRSKTFGKFLSNWIMSEQHGKYNKKKDANLFYCFVSIAAKAKPRFFIIPAVVVARYIRNEFALFCRARKKEGKKVKDAGMRQFRVGSHRHKGKLKITPTIAPYEDNWKFKN